MFNTRCGLREFIGDRCHLINCRLAGFLDVKSMKSRNLMDTVILITIMERDLQSHWTLGGNYLSLPCMCTPPKAMKQLNAPMRLEDLLKS